MGGSYENLEGSTSTWSNQNDLSLTVDVHAVTAVALDATQDSYEA